MKLVAGRIFHPALRVESPSSHTKRRRGARRKDSSCPPMTNWMIENQSARSAPPNMKTPHATREVKSGRPGSNRRHPAWEANVKCLIPGGFWPLALHFQAGLHYNSNTCPTHPVLIIRTVDCASQATQAADSRPEIHQSQGHRLACFAFATPRPERHGSIASECSTARPRSRHYHDWVSAHLRGQTPSLKPKRRKKLDLQAVDAKPRENGVPAEILPGSLLHITSGLLRYEESRIRIGGEAAPDGEHHPGSLRAAKGIRPRNSSIHQHAPRPGCCRPDASFRSKHGGR